MKNRKIIGIAGPCGSGKSTFTKFLSDSLKIKAIEEPIPFDTLKLFEGNPQKYSYDLQVAFIEGKIQAIKKIDPATSVIFDRIVEEDREVFFQLHHLLGFLTTEQLTKLVSSPIFRAS